jgi:amino acid adenylation domain-containing protein/non-ribosomal peptide synthase protein (TIGR01720 family)
MTLSSKGPGDSGYQPANLVELLQARSLANPEGISFKFLSDGAEGDTALRYREMDMQARAIAATLQELAAPGERAMLCYPVGLEYVAALFGCLYAGVIAVPAYPPRLHRGNERLQVIAADAQARLALTTSRIQSRSERLLSGAPVLARMRWLATDDIHLDQAEQWRPQHTAADALAYLQYTSGSTSTPRGVMVTHANVLHNCAYINQGFEQTSASVGLSWLPHFHDMGLIQGILQPVYVGMLGLLMSPAAFLQQPFRWLQLISERLVTHSGGPNFAYDLCVSKVTAEQRATLDLSHWRVAFNGAEPIRPETLERFAEIFAPCGFQRRALYPAYGLAEATLKVSGAAQQQGPVYCRVRADALERHLIVEQGECEGAPSRMLVSSGQVSSDTRVVIVNPETSAKCAPDEVGEIWVSGPSVAVGYWNRPDETEGAFKVRLRDSGEGPFLRTGDLGFLRGEEMFVTGRLKDLIIIRGRNHYPQDIERTVEFSHPDLRTDSGAAFAVTGRMTDGGERLVIVQELEPRRSPEPRAVIAAIRRAVAESHELQPAGIVLVPAGSVPKTSSGKVRRGDCRRLFLKRHLDVVAEWQAPDDVEPPASRFSKTAALASQEELETWITSQLCATLGFPEEEINKHRPLAEYGVDSLLAVELSHRLEVALGIIVPMSSILDSPSIAELAARARSSRLSPSTQVAEDAITTEHPLSRGQQALWYIHEISPASAAYTIANAARIKGPLDIAALRWAFQRLVDRHPCLRSTFSAVLGEPAQLVHEGAEVAFDYEDADRWDESRLNERLVELGRRPFDLEAGPLLSIHLFRRADTEHVLLLRVHHIVADFWSLAVLMSELGALYDAEKDGSDAPLAPLPYQYADYVSWQEQMLAGEEGAHLWDYWRRQLAGEAPALSLPTDRPRPPLQTYRGATEAFHIGAEMTARLKALGSRHGATLYAVLLAVFQTLLHRYSNQDDIAVGSPTAGRSRAGFADLVGYFVNPVVMRADFSANPTFAEFLECARRTALEAFGRQDYPFALLVKRLQPERDASRSPLFQAMFVLQKSHLANAPGLAQFALGEGGARLRLGSLELESLPLGMRVAQFDLTLSAAELEAGLAFSLEYNADLFDDATAARMADHFRTLIESGAANPQCPVADLQLMSLAESERLLVEWNDTAGEFSTCRLIHDLFAAHAERSPDSIAVSDERQQLSYGQLNERADRLTGHLRLLGIGPESRVAVYASRSVEMIVALLGVLKAGGAYVPIDVEIPRERLAFIIDDSRAAALLTERRMADWLTGINARIVCIDEGWQTPVCIQPAPRALPGNTAYVIYTSGSTGRPKGVMVPHEALVNYIDAMGEWLGVSEQDRALQFAAISFDASAEEIFTTLTRGGRLVLRSSVMIASAESFINECRLLAVTALNLPTAYWHELVMNTTEEDWASLTGLRLMVIGGERALAERLSVWRRIAPAGVRLVNTYGPTETTIVATLWEAPGKSLPGLREIPIGRPVRNMRAYIIDARLHPTPVGVPGELCLAGINLARGYLNGPDVTAAKFIPNPFADRSGARLYRTGDVARWRPDGEIECLGRNDQQVKVRGFRIELGEIESALSLHPSVDEAVALAKEVAPGRRRLVAYARSRDAKLTDDALRAFLKRQLPDYMIPSAVLVLDEFPRTNGGKVARRLLPEPEQAESPLSPGAAPPQTDAERRLAEIWAGVLRLPSVGVHENFFELGGDSILSIQVIARARQVGLELSAKQLLAHPTIAELAAMAVNRRSERAEQGEGAGEAPLTPIQRWFFEQRSPNVNHWNMALSFETSAPLIPSIVESALRSLLAHHDALRLRFTETSAGWRQCIAADDQAPFATIDLSGLPADEQEAALRQASAAAQTALNISHGPLIRLLLFDMGEGRANRLLLVVHHLAIDAVSWRILLEDFETAYRQLERGERARLPLKTTPFMRWAQQLTEGVRTPEIREQTNYWLTLGEEEARPLPIDFAHGENLEGSARTLSVSLGEAQTRRLLYAAPQAYHAEVLDLLLTALADAFARWTGAGALMVEVEGHGREELQGGVDLSRSVGWFTSAFPMKLALEAGSDPGGAVKAIKEQRRRIPQRGIGYGLLRYLSAEPSIIELMRKLPLPGASFNYVGRLDEAFAGLMSLKLVPSDVGPLRCPDAERSHLIEINGGVLAGRLQLNWTYSSNLHRRETIAKLAQDFLGSLERLIEHDQPATSNGCSPADFPLAKLDQKRLTDLLSAAGDVEDIYPLSSAQQGLLFHSLYAPQSAMYMAQLALGLRGQLDGESFARAWQQAIDRHAALRTTFVWEDLDEPLQVVHRSARLPLFEADWRHLPPAEQAERLEAFLRADRERDFELSASPPMRFAMLRLGDEAYEFVWSHHHLLIDGWSFSTLLAEVFSAYETLRKRERVRLPQEQPYRDYIEWLNGQSAERAESFWRATLEGFATATPIPFERGDGGVAPGRSAPLAKSMGAPSTARLQVLARQERLTVNTIIQAAWAILLGRHAGERDVVFGATVSGRPPELPGVEEMIGLFINTLPVRVELSPDETTFALMKRLHAWRAESQQYEYSRLVKIHEWSGAQRGAALFKSILVFENYPLDAAALKKSLSFDIRTVRSFERTNYPLTLVVAPGAELRLELLYDPDRIDATGAARLLDHLQTLVESIVAEPGRRLSELAMLSEGERQELLVTHNDTAREYPASTPVHDLFEQQATLTPDAIAVAAPSGAISYGELAARANQLARRLRENGVTTESVVGIALPRGVDLVIASLAALKAGGVCLPLDLAYPAARLSFMLKDTEARLLLTRQEFSGSLPAFDGRVIYVDCEQPRIAAESVADLADHVQGDRLAYVLYTSGSTGVPKGAAIPHRAVNRLVRNTNYIHAGPADNFAQLSSASFDASLFEIWGALLNGGRLTIIPLETALLPPRLAESILTHQVTTMFLTTTLFNELALQAPHAFQSLSVALFGGEAADPKWVREALRAAPACRFVNGYGPTEGATFTTFEVVEAVAENVTSIPIGAPISNSRAHALDELYEPAPAGVAGELYAGGAGLARGYYNRPDLTAERFIPDPFADEPGARLYRTGDVVRRLADLRIDYLGRKDHQVKLRGFRIDLGEIETVLRQAPGVHEAVVLLKEGANGDKRLVAYLSFTSQSPPSDGELRQTLLEKLPKYMVPAAFVTVEGMPLTTAGKVDRAALRKFSDPPAVKTESATPRDAVEESVAAIWSEILGVEVIGVHDNFFELGGHSLLATRVISAIRQIFKMELPLKTLFESATVEQFAAAVSGAEARPGQAEKIARVYMKMRRMSAEDRERALRQKRQERNQ